MKRKSSGKRLFGMRNGRFFVSNTRLPEETALFYRETAVWEG